MPRLWTETIATHRAQVGDAIVGTAAGLVAEHGLRAVTMSAIAEGAGVGRATLYKYFPDVEAILLAWHERHVAAHLASLEEVRDSGGGLPAVLLAYAQLSRDVAGGRHTADLVALVHRDEHVAHARQRLTGFLTDLVAEAAAAGTIRGDVPADELAAYCLAALSAAAGLPTAAAVRRLVEVTLAGLRPGSGPTELLGPVGGGDDRLHHRGAHGA